MDTNRAARVVEESRDAQAQKRNLHRASEALKAGGASAYLAIVLGGKTVMIEMSPSQAEKVVKTMTTQNTAVLRPLEAAMESWTEPA